MKNTIPFLFLLFGSISFSQNNPDIFLFDLAPANEGLELLNMRNISNNTGYDNQPSFQTDNLILFAGNNNGQTDIAQYNIEYKSVSWYNILTEGGEYSPQKFPSLNDVAAVRLDPDGLQRLYKYNFNAGKSSILIPDLQIAYFTFYDDNRILASVLSNDKLDLVLIDLQKKTNDTLLKNVGRCIQKIPKSNSMSYTVINQDKNLDLYIWDIISKESFFVCELPQGVQDYIWLNDTQILLGSGNNLYRYDTLGDSEWEKMASLEPFKISSPTRMAISPNGKHLAIVSVVTE